MYKTKKFFSYKNKIILSNGSSLKITSNKYIKNYQLNLTNFKKIETILNDTNVHKNKLNFIKNKLHLKLLKLVLNLITTLKYYIF